jgi:hypothetical protein
LDDAYIVPQSFYRQPEEGEGRRPIYDGGVYRSDGTVCEPARHVSTSTEHVPAATLLEPAKIVEGNFLYGGVMRGHFGHFLVESIGRLWALAELKEPVNGIIYLPMYNNIRTGGVHPNARYKTKSYIRNFLKLIGADIPLLFPAETWRVSRLHVPGQLLMNSPNAGIGGHPVLRDFLKRRFDDHFGGMAKPHRWLYLSRSRVPIINSAYLQEDRLEQNLIENGYEVIYPEALSIEEQVRLYRESARILIAEGSSAHLVALTAHAGQKIGIVNRLKARYSPGKFERQIRSFGCEETYTFDAVAVMYQTTQLYPPLRLRNAVISTLDFDRLGSMLVDKGFIAPGRWRTPSVSDLDDATAEAVAILREETLYP